MTFKCRILGIEYIIQENKKVNNFLLTVVFKYGSMKSALLWCYMPIQYYYSI